jgi:poly(hydroxyalkanoate) depolymerase family esterase
MKGSSLMNYSLGMTMREAMRLMQTGDLHAATAAIQRGLTRAEDRSAFHAGYPVSAPEKPCIDAESRVVDVAGPEPIADHPGLEPLREIREPTGEPFQQHSFTCAAGTRRYKLFIPKGHPGRPLPLLIMLHGCTQSPDDFARGTRMNQLAEEEGYYVVYPAQSARDNPTKCWNWFRPADQCRDRGEPAIIAELTRYVVRVHRLDRARVYVAGLSAGAAMAVILARTYPDIYAAAGVHSGLPYGSAHDVPSAFAAMKQGSGISVASTNATEQALGASVPTIVFHGDRDMVVGAHNGDTVIAQSMASLGDSVSDGGSCGEKDKQVEQGVVPGGYSYTRTMLQDPQGRILAEQWLVHGAGHAWFGGDPTGSYTDPKGPDASAEMLRFFGIHARRNGN